MKYIKLPVTIEAFRWSGGPELASEDMPRWITSAIEDGDVWFARDSIGNHVMQMNTMEGVVRALPGEWIIRGVAGEIYPCRDSIFRETYAAADRGDVIPNGISLIEAERIRQRVKEHYDAAHDDEHTNYELSRAACCYAETGYGGPYSFPSEKQSPPAWPWDGGWKPSADPIRNLSKAGALIAAEIDRVLRMRSRMMTEFSGPPYPTFDRDGIPDGDMYFPSNEGE